MNLNVETKNLPSAADAAPSTTTTTTTKLPRRATPVPRFATLDGEPVVYLELTQGMTAIVDEESWLRIEPVHGSRWNAMTNGKGRRYVQGSRNTDSHTLRGWPLLHRLVIEAKPGQRVTFVNGNTLDCRRSNLRFESTAETREKIAKAKQQQQRANAAQKSILALRAVGEGQPHV